LGFTVIVITLLVSVGGETHAALLVITQVTLSPLFIVVLVYVGVLPPTGTLFINHWYVGDGPPFVTEVEKVTLVPAHITFPGFTLIVTSGVTLGFTVISAPLSCPVTTGLLDTTRIR
jgi:hypothetical protein